MEKLREATKEDFKIGTILIMKQGWGFRITDKYGDGIWNATGVNGQGGKAVFENEAKFYKVKA